MIKDISAIISVCSAAKISVLRGSDAVEEGVGRAGFECHGRVEGGGVGCKSREEEEEEGDEERKFSCRVGVCWRKNLWCGKSIDASDDDEELDVCVVWEGHEDGEGWDGYVGGYSDAGC
jgi:hypothetical protein